MNPSASARIAAAIHRRYGEDGRGSERPVGRRRARGDERALGLPALSRRAGARAALASRVRDCARVADEERSAAGEHRSRELARRPRGDPRDAAGLAVDRRRAGVPRLLRRRLPAAAHLRAARARISERAPRRVLQRRRRRGDRALDVRAGGRARGPRQLPDQRDPQPRAGDRRNARAARLGLPDRRPDARLARVVRAVQPAARADGDGARGPLRREPRRPGARRATTSGASAIAPTVASASPSASAPPNATAGPRTRRASTASRSARTSARSCSARDSGSSDSRGMHYTRRDPHRRTHATDPIPPASSPRSPSRSPPAARSRSPIPRSRSGWSCPTRPAASTT